MTNQVLQAIRHTLRTKYVKKNSVMAHVEAQTIFYDPGGSIFS